MLGLDTFYPTFASQNFTNNSDVISFNLGPVYDPDSGDKMVVTITITPSSWSKYFTVDPLSVVLKVNNLVVFLIGIPSSKSHLLARLKLYYACELNLYYFTRILFHKRHKQLTKFNLIE